MTAVWVGVAGASGVLVRYAISYPLEGPTLSWTTVAINVVGSFLLGLLITIDALSTETRTALGVGFLGGFTTFSTFSVQAFQDINSGHPERALTYIAASVGLGITAAAAGHTLGQNI